MLAQSGPKGLVEAGPAGAFAVGRRTISSGGATTLFDVPGWIARRSTIFAAHQCYWNAIRFDYPKRVDRRCQSMENSGPCTDKSLAFVRSIHSYRERTLDSS